MDSDTGWPVSRSCPLDAHWRVAVEHASRHHGFISVAVSDAKARFMDATFSQVPDSIRFVDEQDLLRITGLPRSTRRRWAERGLVVDPEDGHYREGDVVETAIVALLVSATKGLDDALRLWSACRGGVMQEALRAKSEEDLRLVFGPRLLGGVLAKSDAEICRAIRPLEPFVVVPLTQATREAREAFWRFAMTSRHKPDRRRRDTQRAAPRGASANRR
jgi:hypothetical protein